MKRSQAVLSANPHPPPPPLDFIVIMRQDKAFTSGFKLTDTHIAH